MERTKLELHTHLMGMLSVNSFINFLEEIGIEKIYWPLTEPSKDSSRMILLSDIKNNNMLYNNLSSQLQIKHGKKVEYGLLTNFYKNRRDLIKFAIYSLEQKGVDFKLAKKIVYNKYINKCLEELVKQGIKYVEISYSISQTLLNFEIREDLKDKITCKFLLSTDRTRSIDNFKESAKDLRKVLNKGISVGFDIMGEETELSLDELNYDSEASFYKKLITILKVLVNDKNTTLRIHSGETFESSKNTEIILMMLEQIKYNSDIDILPPPEIRIGHGIYFNKNDNYLRLLKKFNCVIEINASSNLALNNIKSYDFLPYKYYIENGIPIVLSTDGHGLYDTNSIIENLIALEIIGEKMYKKIIEYDSIFYSKKVGGKL